MTGAAGIDVFPLVINRFMKHGFRPSSSNALVINRMQYLLVLKYKKKEIALSTLCKLLIQTQSAKIRINSLRICVTFLQK